MEKFKGITFDYFGTLVDVDKGGATGMERVLERIGARDKDPSGVYLTWDQLAVQTYRGGPYQKYRDVARRALDTTLTQLDP